MSKLIARKSTSLTYYVFSRDNSACRRTTKGERKCSDSVHRETKKHKTNKMTKQMILDQIYIYIYVLVTRIYTLSEYRDTFSQNENSSKSVFFRKKLLYLSEINKQKHVWTHMSRIVHDDRYTYDDDDDITISLRIEKICEMMNVCCSFWSNLKPHFLCLKEWFLYACR